MINSFIDNLTKLFIDTEIVVKWDNFSSFEADAKVNGSFSFRVPDEGKLLSFFNQLNGTELFLSFHFEDQDETITFSTSNLNFSSKLIDLNDCFEKLGIDECLTFEIRIVKKKSNSIINVFSSSDFFSYLSSLSLKEILEKFGGLDFDEPIGFCFWEESESFSSDSIFFYSVYPDDDSTDFSNNFSKDKRKKILENRAKVSHFVNAENNVLLPEDFNIRSGKAPVEISSIFNGIIGVLSFIFISDFSSIKDNILDVQVKGYKKVLDTLLFSEMKTANHDEIYNIYSWAYSDGSFVDKIGVARNVMSIHLVNGRLLNMGGGVLDSVLSGYDLYLKENVKQYIEIKNKINDFLYSQSDKSQALVESVFSTIKTSMWGFSTFFISVFLLRVVSGKSLDGVVTGEVLSVSFLLVFISCLYVVFTFNVLKVDKIRLLSKYKEVRDRYLDIMNEDDLDRIMKTSEIEVSEESYIDGRAKSYIKLWVLICVSFIIVNVAMYLYGKFNEPQSKAQKVIPEVKDDAINSVINFICIAPKLETVKSCQIEKKQREEYDIPSAPLREEVEEDFLRS